MLAQNNEYLQETVSGVHQLTAEEQIRQHRQAREDYLYWERIREAQTTQLKEHLADKDAYIANAQAEIANKDAYIAKLEAEIGKEKAFLEKMKEISRRIAKGLSLEQIAAELEEEVDFIRPIYDELIAMVE